MITQYLEKVYAGFLGMNIGIRLGAPVEPSIWTYDRIQNTYGDIHDYVKDYKNFAADDDVNGPVYFLRSLIDDAYNRELTPQDVAKAWLNYAREGVGMFWWGGYGISTEHTAYLNLKHGIKAPQSGSIEQNGSVLAEQIGGQIFIDTWGFTNPDNPQKAADYGQIAASVSHDGNALYGARFICAAISRAFVSSDILDIIQTALKQIPETCTYRAVVEAVLTYHNENPDRWRDCYKYLRDEWGYDKYPGVCHIIPNAGVCAMALLYGAGKFDRSIEIATMAGWDTDCNAGNVGSILGVCCGLSGIPEKYRSPINDGIVLSGISGYLNNLNVPCYAKHVAALGYHLAGEKISEDLQEFLDNPNKIHFDFDLPGSTHNIRLSDTFLCSARNSTEVACKGTGSLCILLDRFVRGDQCRVFYKPFYTREDFSDERYSPVFSPTVYSGQTLSVMLYLDQWNGNETPGAAPYIRTCHDGCIHMGGYTKLVQHQWINICYKIPDTKGDVIDEVGIILEGYSPAKFKTLGRVFLDEFTISGKSDYTIDTGRQVKNFNSITPFSTDHGAWDLYNKTLNLLSIEPAFAYCGDYYSRNYELTATIVPHHGTGGVLVFRALGAMRGYLAGFTASGKAGILINDFGFRELASCDYPWKYEQPYSMKVVCKDSEFSLFIDGTRLLTVNDSTFTHGMWGCGLKDAGRSSFSGFHLHEL